MSPPTIRLEPLVSWPRIMMVGQEYLVTVDLRLARIGDEWPYREEEFAFDCMLDGGERIVVESVDDISVILHRFGGTYGPARFIVTAQGDPGQDAFRLVLSTQRGATVRTDKLPVRITAPGPVEEGPRVDLRSAPGDTGRESRRGGETWVAAIHLGDDPAPVGAGVLLGENRVLTCTRVVPAGPRFAEGLWVTFPHADEPTRRYGASMAPPGALPGDLAVLVLSEPPSPEVTAAPVQPRGEDDLVGRRWSVSGLPGGEGSSVTVSGIMNPAPGHRGVTLTTDSGRPLDPALRGAAVWSPGHEAVIGVVVEVGERGGLAATIREADSLIPGQRPETRERTTEDLGPRGRPVPPARPGPPFDHNEDVLPADGETIPPPLPAGLPDDRASVRREPTDVILAIEMSGRDEAVLRRRRLAAATIEQLADRYPGRVRVAVIGYTYHDFSRGGDGQRRVVTGSWLEPAEKALASLAGLESTRTSFPGAAPLEDALHHIDRLLPTDEPDRPVVLLVLAKQPPHPVRTTRDAVLPCPHRYDHRKSTDRLAERGVRLMTVIDDASGRTFPHLRRLGSDYSVELRWADPVALVDAMAIHRTPPARVPTLGLGTWPGHAPGRAQRVYDIGLLGTTASGRTSFLTALSVATLRHDSDWMLLGADESSTDRLVTLTQELVRKRRFPTATASAEDPELVLLGRNLSRGFWGIRRETDVSLHLSTADTFGGPHDEARRRLAACDGLIYFFDPVRELRQGDASDALRRTLLQLGRYVDADGRLPQRLAICVTKFDDPAVFAPARRGGHVTFDDPEMLPRVPDDQAAGFFHELCARSGSTGGDLMRDMVGHYFHPDRIKYFVTSAIGFHVGPAGVFHESDYSNVVQERAGAVRVRGRISPVNVLEPFLWLARP
ncbi:hypothetical protein [Streptosporangium sp. NPDC002524]|uniref:hypothetical protein n=1 Tax=Streptosporangium sp. NPDC002524 TaxID=3154537 RepID=UPI00332764E3